MHTTELWQALAPLNGLVVVKERRNSALNAAYANYADVWEAIRPTLKEAGVTISFRQGAMREVGAQFAQDLTLVAIHVPTGQREEFTGSFPLPEGNRGVNFAQRFGSASTYAMRYALVAFLGLVTGDDDDAARARQQGKWQDADSAPEPSSNPDAWPALMNGAWRNVIVPGDDNLDRVTFDQLNPKHIFAVWTKEPSNAAACAWCADWIEGALQERGIGWSEFATVAGGNWPDTITGCSPDELRAAARLLKDKDFGRASA